MVVVVDIELSCEFHAATPNLHLLGNATRAHDKQ